MRVYEGTPRERWQEVLRVLGALADRESLRELLLLELDEGLVLQALTLDPVRSRSEWAALHKRTLTFDDDEIARLMEEGRSQRAAEDEAAAGRRRRRRRGARLTTTSTPCASSARTSTSSAPATSSSSSRPAASWSDSCSHTARRWGTASPSSRAKRSSQ